MKQQDIGEYTLLSPLLKMYQDFAKWVMEKLFFPILIVFIFSCTTYAEMQMWIDKDGVKHFSNTGAPQETEFETSDEIKYNKEKATYYKAVADEKEYQKNQEEARHAQIKYEQESKKQVSLEQQEERREELERQFAKNQAIERINREKINRQIYPTHADSIYWRYNTRPGQESQEDDYVNPQPPNQQTEFKHNNSPHTQYPATKTDPVTGTVYRRSSNGNYINNETGTLNKNRGGNRYVDVQTGQVKRIE